MALRDQPYLPLYVQDYLTDEKLSMCSWTSQGVYIKLLCLLHKSDPYGTILLKQNDKPDLNFASNFASKIMKLLPIERDVLIAAITELVNEKCLTIEGNKLFQKRMVRDNEISLIRSETGKKGGLKTQKIAKAKVKAPAKAKAKANADIDIDIVNDIDIDVESDVRRTTLSETRFNDFWDAYPNKKGKKAAFAAWKKAKVTADLHAKLLSAIRLQKTSAQWQKDNGQYIPNPATWLNQGRWDDEISSKEQTDKPLPKFCD